jgi:hypothetical protein
MSNNRWTFLGEISSGTRRRPGVEELEQRTLFTTGLSAAGIPEVSMLAGHRYTGRVATFVDPHLTSWAGNVTVTINWGDGSAAEQTTDIRPLGNGKFEVWGTHEYNTGGAIPLDMTVRVKERTGSSALATSLFQIVNPAVSLQLAEGTYTHGRPISFKISASQTPNNQPPTAYLMEYQAPGETTWHVISRGTWHGTSPSHGDFLLSGTITPPRAGRFLVRALATVGGVEYPSHSLTITVR